MAENPTSHPRDPNAEEFTRDEGGLRAPPGLSFWGKAWWWFHFLILVKIARLRFIGILILIGVVIVKWDTILAYYDKWTRPEPTEQVASSGVEWYCPMHPTVIRDNPKEKCPICFMPLSKRKVGEARDEALPPGIVNRVQLSPYKVVLAGIQTWKVTHHPLTKDISTVGFVEFDERNLKQVAARVKGRLDELYVNQHGQVVNAGDDLASLYSPELVVTVQNYLDAHRSNNADMMRNAAERLRLWGIEPEQIEAIRKTGKPITHLKIRSPIHGHIIKKYVKEGQYVEEGMPLYEVADLSTVWIQAQVYEYDLAFLPTTKEIESKLSDMSMVATVQGLPSEVFKGKLTFVYPHVNQDARTVVARFELDNPEHKLRPGMTANVKLKVPPKRIGLVTKALTDDLAKQSLIDVAAQTLSNRGVALANPGLASLIVGAGRQAMLQQGYLLVVPEGAVIDTGSLQLVYRQILPGEYEGVKVELGPRMMGPGEVSYYPVLAGLQAGDVIVTAGSFLVDAETRLNPAAGSIYFAGSSGSKTGAGVTSVRPSTPDDEDAKIQASLDRLSDSDRRLAEAQVFCPVMQDSRLGSMGAPIKLVIRDQPVFICCSSCEKNAVNNPDRTLERVTKLKKEKAQGK